MIEWDSPEKFIGTTAAIIMAASAAATAGASVYGASKQAGAATQAAQTTSDAQLKAAQLQDEANKRAEAFARQTAETDWQNQELTRQANYNQWAAQQQRRGSIGSLFGLPSPTIPGYVPGVDPKYTTTGAPLPNGPGGGAPPTLGSNPSSTGSSTTSGMPPGIDPRFAALYQKYGVTPGPRGSGPADWQYYQQDAVAHAGGDVNYILGRLEQDLQKGGGGGPTTTASNTTATPGSIASYLSWKNPLYGSLPLSTAPLAQPGTQSYGIGSY